MIRLAEPYVDETIKDKILEVIESKMYVDGKYTREFENLFSRYIGVRNAVAVSSGTSALYLILKALNIGKGDYVAVPSFTFISTVSQVVEVGAKPIFIDVEYDTMCMDPEDLEKKMNRDVKAIIPVHLFGHPADLDPIIEMAEKYGAYIIEDSAQAHGSRYRGRKVGGIGHIGYFSLYPSKNLGVYGEGGVITTDDDELARRIRRLKNHGIENGEIVEFGYNFKFNEINAVVALESLKYLDRWNDRRRNIAEIYNEELSELDIEIPVEKEYAYHVYNLYTIKTYKREKLIRKLREKGISYGIYYDKPVHTLDIVKRLFKPPRLPNTERLKDIVLSIPIHPFLRDGEIRYIIDSIREGIS